MSKMNMRNLPFLENFDVKAARKWSPNIPRIFVSQETTARMTKYRHFYFLHGKMEISKKNRKNCRS